MVLWRFLGLERGTGLDCAHAAALRKRLVTTPFEDHQGRQVAGDRAQPAYDDQRLGT
jgi:hypothetical protein